MSQQNPTPASLLPQVITLVKNAGTLIRSEFHSALGPRGSGDKADVDIAAEVYLRKQLITLHRAAFLGEETGRCSDHPHDIWVVDPQDGTTDFLAKRRGSAVSVALLRDGQPVLGVVYAPLAPDDDGDLIAWAKGAPLTRNGKKVKRPAPCDPTVIAMGANAGDYARLNHEAMPDLRILAMPSPAYRLALAAVGDVDAAVCLSTGLAHWDIAGGHALLIGAGLALVDCKRRAFDYAQPYFNGCIGGRPEVFDRINLRPGRGQPRRPAYPRDRIADTFILSRAQGCLLGQIAGDALGSAVEFQDATSIARTYPKGVRWLADGGTFDLIAGQPTDDGEMALTLARSLVARRGFDRNDVSGRYQRWLESGPFDLGMTTRSAITQLAARKSVENDSQANGALMRVSPIGIFATGDRCLAARMARQDCRLTHPHPVCMAANTALATAIAVAVDGDSGYGIYVAATQFLGQQDEVQPVYHCLKLALDGHPPKDYQHQMGWVLTALHNAFYHLHRGTPLAEALTQTVGQGGDTDTNAAICGALLGAVQGREAIPAQWQRAILTCRPAGGPGIRHPRPSDYWPDDALDLAEALLVARHRLP